VKEEENKRVKEYQENKVMTRAMREMRLYRYIACLTEL
jgi:hypothetical protein